MAADALDGGGLMEQYGEEALLEAIASARLYRVDDSFFFDPEEVLAILRSTKRFKTLPQDGPAPWPLYASTTSGVRASSCSRNSVSTPLPAIAATWR